MQQAAIPHNTPPLPPQRHTNATHLYTTMHNLNTTHATTCTPTCIQHAHHNTQVHATNQTTPSKTGPSFTSLQARAIHTNRSQSNNRSCTQHQVTDHKQKYIAKPVTATSPQTSTQAVRKKHAAQNTPKPCPILHQHPHTRHQAATHDGTHTRGPSPSTSRYSTPCRCHLAANCCCVSRGLQPLSQSRGTPELTRTSP